MSFAGVGTRLVGAVFAVAAASCAHVRDPHPKSYDLVVSGACIVRFEPPQSCLTRDILVDNGVIAAITAPGAAPPGAREHVDADGLWALPGLWDMHVHALWDDGVYRPFFRDFVAHGVLGVRDMGGDLDVLKKARAQIDQDNLLAPRLYAAGAFLDGPAPMDPALSLKVYDQASAFEAIDILVEAGADFAKTYTLLPADAAAPLFEAERRGLRVAGHWPAAWPAEDAAKLASIEHLRAELRGYCPDSDCAPVFETFARTNVRHTPALIVRRERLHPQEAEKAAAYARLPAPVVEYWSSSSARDVPESERAQRRADYAGILSLARQVFALDLPVLAGTDAGLPGVYPGASLIEELEIYQSLGTTPARALQTAVSEPARFLGLEGEAGVLKEGARADFILLRADPLADVANLRKLEAVVLKGRRYGRQALDRMLAENEADAEH